MPVQEVNKLSPRQQGFAHHYALSGNASEAAIKAGYSEKTARSTSSRLLTKENIREAIDKRLATFAEVGNITIQDLVNELGAMATFSIEDIVDIDESDGKSVIVKDFKDIPANAKKAIKEIQTVQLADGGGVAYKIQFYDKIKSIELLGKHFGMFIERHEIGKPGDFDKLTDEELDARIRAEEKDKLSLNVTGAERKKGQKALNPVHPVH